MTKVLNTYGETDFNKLAAMYPYRDEHGLPVLEESLEDYAKRTNQALNTVKKQVDRAQIPINQHKKGGKRTVNLYAIFLKTIINAEKYVLMTK